MGNWLYTFKLATSLLLYITSCYTVMQVFSEKSYIMITAIDIIEKTRTLEDTACPQDRLTLHCVVYTLYMDTLCQLPHANCYTALLCQSYTININYV